MPLLSIERGCNMAKTMLVGLSGGVDSAVAALLLKEQGAHVIGVTLQMMKNHDPAAIEDARRVAAALGIRHEVLDMQERFRREVQDMFAAEYRNGRTPNPCVCCNRMVKWAGLLDAADEFAAEGVATGHYARILRDENGGRFTIAESPGGKDQSYALCALTQAQLARTHTPLWAMTKEEVRGIAAAHHLPVAAKPDSQEICFVPDDDHAAFIGRHTGLADVPGDFLDASGQIIGRHKGLAHYTIGQRKGLGAFGRPVFVTALRPAENAVILGDPADLLRTKLTANAVNFMALAPDDSALLSESGLCAEGKIRYNQKPAPCRIWLRDGALQCEFDTPQRAITPGQAAVFYREGKLLCAGTIQ